MRDYKAEFEGRVAFIKDLVKSANASGIVFGNSGGKDCALVGILCKAACDNTLSVIMPCASSRNFGSDMDDGNALAEQFGITVNDLLEDPDALPEETGKVQQAMEQVVEKTLKRKADKKIILGLSSILVWSVALLVYVIFSSLDMENSWLAFFYAVPANAIVLLSLRSAWHDFRWNRALISAIMWGAIVSLYATLLVLGHWNVWRLFLLGIPGQIAIFLWFRLFRPVKKEEQDG